MLAGAERHPQKQRQTTELEGAEAGLIEKPPERLYDDRQLSSASTISTAIECQCPHHLADLILSLCHFEEYSARCESQSRDDAALHAYALNDKRLLAALFRMPLMTFKVMAAIHWQALKIRLRGAPFFPKPAPPVETVTQ